MAGYIGSKAVITSGVSASIDELNIIDGVTATTAELNILDGVTSTAAELNILDGVTSTATELNILDGVTATTAELNIMDGVTATTAELNIMDGVTSTAAELNIMDGVTATAAEINLIDGGTARGTTAVADGDGVLINDAGTMRQTNVTTLATYMGTKITGGSMVYLASTGAISNAANVSFTQFDASKYDHYEFWLQNVVPASDNQTLECRVSTNGGSNYDSTNGNYHEAPIANKTGLTVAGSVGSDSGDYGISGTFQLFAPHNANTFTMARSNMVYNHYGDALRIGLFTQASQHITAQDVDAVQFVFNSGNIESGEIVMYGLANGS